MIGHTGTEEKRHTGYNFDQENLVFDIYATHYIHRRLSHTEKKKFLGQIIQYATTTFAYAPLQLLSLAEVFPAVLLVKITTAITLLNQGNGHGEGDIANGQVC